MSLLQQVDKDIVSALKNGDRETANVLRLLKNALEVSKKSLMRELEESEEQKILKKEIKNRLEARNLYVEHGEKARADKEDMEIKILSVYAPDELSEQDVIKIIEKVVDDKGTEAGFGVLMSEVIKEVSGRADGKIIAMLLTNKLKGEEK